MKTSSIIVFAGIAIAIMSMAAANIKLKTDYEKKNIREYVVYTDLPPFHYIKDNFIPKYPQEWYVCDVTQSTKFGVGSGFDNAQELFSYTVKNDTLLIEQKAKSALINDVIYGIPIKIYCGPLKGVVSKIAEMNISGKMADSITAIVTDKGSIRFKHLQTLLLKAEANNKGKISVLETDTLPGLSLHLNSQSAFSADNVVISNKTVRLSDSASLQLVGRSLQTFGLGKMN